MVEAIQLELQPLNRARPTRFTPERMQQVRNLVERGKTEEIAEIIGATIGSLQVTCSKLGMSLRRPTFDTGTGLLRRPRSPVTKVPHQLNRGYCLEIRGRNAQRGLDLPWPKSPDRHRERRLWALGVENRTIGRPLCSPSESCTRARND